MKGTDALSRNGGGGEKREKEEVNKMEIWKVI